MKRRSFLFAASAVAAAGLVVQPRESHATPTPYQPSVGAPKLDGPAVPVRHDLAFVAREASQLDLTTPLSDGKWGPPVTDNATTFYDLNDGTPIVTHLAHTATHLYVGVRITGGDAATATYLSCLVKGPGQSGYLTTTVQLRPPTIPWVHDWLGETTPLVDAAHHVDAADDEIVCTMAIPLTELLITGDAGGKEVRLNLILDHDDQTTRAVSTAPVRSSSNWYQGRVTASVKTSVADEDRAAFVFLTELPALSAARRTASLQQLTAPALEYISYRSKRLHWQHPSDTVTDDVRLVWHPPHGEPSPIDTSIQPGRWLTAEFTHPEPTIPGQYAIQVINRSRTGTDSVAYLVFDRQSMINAGDRLPQNRPTPPTQTAKVDPVPASDAVLKLITLVPDRAGFRFCGVPDAPELHPDNVFDFSPAAPDRLVAKLTKTVYPNAAHPEDRSLTVINRLGQQVEYPYHEDAAGRRYFLSAHAWYRRREQVYASLGTLATTDPLGAARVLHRLAEVYPGWVPTNEYPWFNRPVNPHSTPRNFYWGGSLTRWAVSDPSALKSISEALRLVEATDALDVLSDELGVDVRKGVIDELIRPAIDFYRSFPLTYGNMDSAAFSGLAATAWALGDSSLPHEIVEWAREYARRSFLFDGFWHEVTVSYHRQSTTGGYAVAAALDGWTDPATYESPRSGARFDELALLTDVPILEAASRIPRILCYPDSRTVPIADTWAAERVPDPLTSVGSTVLGASKITRLSRGRVLPSGPFGVINKFPELVVEQQNVAILNVAASGTSQLEASESGATVTWRFDAPAADTYDLDLVPFYARSYGQYEVSVDDVVIANHDFYSLTAGVADAFTLAQIDLAAGPHTITFRGTGKRAESTNYKMGVVTLALLDEAARHNRDEAATGTANPSQLYLAFAPKYGSHNHWDPLNLTLWAEGQELLPDLGYTHTRFATWTKTPLAHNTVTVDSANMDSASGLDGGSLEIFDDSDASVQVQRADYRSAYPQTSRYEREIWSFALPDTTRDEGYYLDIFRVSGGSRHELTFHGDANRDAEMITPTELADYGPRLLPPGVEVTEPTRETETGSAQGHYYGYMHIRDVRRAALADGAFDVTVNTETDSGPGSAVRLLGSAGAGTELFVGRSPSLRATRLKGTGSDTNTEAEKWTSPTLVLRRDGNTLASTFVTTIEPMAAGTEPRIANVVTLDHDGGTDVVAVKVTHHSGVEDIILSTPDGASAVHAGGVTLVGRLGWVRVQDGQAVAAHLVSGTQLSGFGTNLESDGPSDGVVHGTLRAMAGDPMDALLTDDAVPSWAVGRIVIVTHPDGNCRGYRVKELGQHDGRTAIVLDSVDPGFEVSGDSSRMAYTPFTTWTGPTRFRIENAVTG